MSQPSAVRKNSTTDTTKKGHEQRMASLQARALTVDMLAEFRSGKGRIEAIKKQYNSEYLALEAELEATITEFVQDLVRTDVVFRGREK